MSGSYVIWHNPKCSTSRFVLDALRDAGIEPLVRNYLKEPPTQEELRKALAATGLGARQLLRQKNTPYHDLGLDDLELTEGDLIAAMAEHPELIERPVVLGPKRSALCRPKETVFEII
ncbi:arsenate reductase (glutaredoxin) [Paracoccus methylarcula]|uniref:arsenate reductase (glutaredoxin) n=1 Tax=Paracoccus methylarcula TaxID=72022 RepID=UPI001B88331D|nr:arsenate reductase (glutaredoxin) [Paracoccus methylarcula]